VSDDLGDAVVDLFFGLVVAPAETVADLGLENRGQVVRIHTAISVGVGRRRRVVEELTIGVPG
jgi:hypothetical protein